MSARRRKGDDMGAYLNALREEGSREDLFRELVKQYDRAERAEAERDAAIRQVGDEARLRGAAEYRAERAEAALERDQTAVITACNKVLEETATSNNATRLLRQCYVTLGFAFMRLHNSARARDGELCLDFQKVRAQIEKHFQKIGVKL